MITHREIDEHLYLVKKHLKELEAYLNCNDFLNAHHAANLVAHHASALSYTEPCCKAIRKAFDEAHQIAKERK